METQAKTMYNYEIGYISYDESIYETLAHEKQFTRYEFDAIMFKAYFKAIKESKEKDPYVSDIYYEVKKILWELGFKNPKRYEQRFVIPDVILHEEYLEQWDASDYRIEVIRHTLNNNKQL